MKVKGFWIMPMIIAGYFNSVFQYHDSLKKKKKEGGENGNIYNNVKNKNKDIFLKMKKSSTESILTLLQ